ncbi:hypothetical protein LSUE1_G001142 [Lachnellula suecica]|uniref:Sexual development protein n=1 Tax=Lachnellula suecica TaxID=602035 RepID=A0A8T9CEM9_9HELO|nr:hypothetical protein LSUE1_G001142 [Lachnellula suecica]
MRSVAAASLIIFSCVASTTSAAPAIPAPFTGGFPNPNADQLNTIELAAHGSLPVSAPNSPPPSFHPDSLTSLRFIAFNELFEVAFFASLINNITTDAAGFKIDNSNEKKDLLDNLNAIVAQEELHALNANKALNASKVDQIQPCKYVFPSENIQDAIALASKFTDVVLATLPDLQTGFANNNDNGLIRGVGSVIGQEGEQNGFFRQYAHAKKIPSALPFLTAGSREFAFSALNQNFVVKGSCPNIQDIDIQPIATALNVPSSVDAKSQNIQFSFDFVGAMNAEWAGPAKDYSGLSLVYINQQNAPVVEKLQNVVPVISGNELLLKFEALFPFNGTTFGNGLTIAAIVPTGADLSSVETVSAAAIAGPGLIEVN